MREIKFRCYYKNEKKMIYFHPLAGVQSMDHQLACQAINIYQNSYIDTHTQAPDENEIIMQYTGIKDKFERDIYEGDIIRCRLNGHLDIKIVKWTTIEDSEYGCVNGHGWDITRKPSNEIIGNIHEHPEKLKGV